MYDASSRKDIRRAEKSARQSEVARTEFVQAAMSTPQGREWFHHILAACHIHDTTFTMDSRQSAFLEGERNIGLRIFAEIMAHCPDLYTKMLQEAQLKELSNGRRAESRADNPDEPDFGWHDPDGESEPAAAE